MDNPDYDLFFATPAIYTPDMSNEEWQAELNYMLQRSMLAHRFVSGTISPDDFMDGLNELGIDPNAAAEHWEEGLVYL